MGKIYTLVFVVVFFIISFSQSQAQTTIYSQTFTGGASYSAGTPQYDQWTTFRNSLTPGGYTRLTIKGTYDAVGVSCTDQTIVNQIATALKNYTGATSSWTSAGRTWMIGSCGSGPELSAMGSICACPSPGYILRPQIGNNNWGGVNTATCGGSTQVMTVEFMGPQYNNDGGVFAINAPQTPIGPGAQNVTVTLQNYGKANLNSAIIRFSVDGTLVNPLYTWSGSLVPTGQSPSPVTIGTYNFTLGYHTIKAWTTSPNGVLDSNKLNDTAVYVVNCCMTKTGTFTIDGTGGGDFTNFQSAINSLSGCGISGPVTFIVRPGTYNAQVVVPPINGASANNTVTFRGLSQSACKITWSGNYGYAATVKLDGADFIRFENLTIENTGTSYYGVDVWFTNNADNNKISNCIMTVPRYTSNQYYMVCLYGGNDANYPYGTGGDNGANNIIENNLMQGGTYGAISWIGSSAGYNINYNNTFRGNIMEYQYYYSMYIQYVGGDKILNNIIRYPDNTSHYGIYNYYCAGDTIDGNTIQPGEYGIYQYYYNNNYAPASWYSLITNNMISNFTNTTYQCGISIYYYCYRQKVLHNTIWVNGSYSSSYSYAAMYVYYPYNSEFRNNILISSGGTMLFTTYYPTTSICDNNLYLSLNPTSGAYYFFYNGSYYDYAGFKAYINSSYFGTHNVNSLNQVDPGVVGMNNLHLKPGNMGLVGYLSYPGVKLDADKDVRCALQSFLGADEPYHKRIVSDFSSSDTMCLVTPVTFYNSIDPTEPHITSWYKNGVFQNNNFHYTTTFTTAGYYKIKMENQTCSGVDSVKRMIYARNPVVVPATEFEAPKNVVETGENMQLFDLSLNCPNRWKWDISPDSVIDPTTSALVPAYTWVNSTDTTQNPVIKFFYPGSFDVCLTTKNAIGTGNTKCKTAYINVKLSAVLCGGTIESKMPFGTLYDDGGLVANHGVNKSCSYLIAPCTDDVMVVFRQFDIGIGAYLKIYDGANNRGIPLWDKSIFPKGLTGNIATTGFQDTLYARKSGMIYVEFTSGANTGPGFRMEWEGIGTGTYIKPVAMFESFDTSCVVYPVYYTNTSIADSQMTSYKWDFDGNNVIDATTVNGIFKTTFPGLAAKYRTYLYARNCGGEDTFYKDYVLINPRTNPNGSFHADVIHPITDQDAVTFSCDAERLNCVDGFNWIITPNSCYFVDGTSKNSAHPRVKFVDTIYYNVTLIMWNTNAPSFSDTAIRLKYIKPVKNCSPVVLNLHADVGISHVQCGSIDQKSSVGVAKYTNYSNTQSTSIFVGQTYNVTLERPTNFNAMNRKVWIDYNGNGSFNDPGELVCYEDSATTLSWTGTFTVPTINLAYGGTILRVGTSYSNNKNSPCGPNLFGEFEDYRVFISPDNVAPIITLKGNDTIFVEKGYPYIDSGAVAIDNIEGNISSRIVISNPVDIHKEGPYYVTYNVCDNLHNCANSKKRLVFVTPDNTAPIITLYGGDPIYTDVNKPVKDSFSATDLGDGNLTDKVILSGYFDNSKLGVYHRVYTVKDSRGLMATASRDIIVSDHAAPDITLLGANPFYLEINKPFIDPGATYSDNYWPINKINYVVTGFMDTTAVGTYTLTYSVTDALGNGPNVKTRKIIIYDSVSPVIVSGKVGDVMEVEVNHKFIDPGLNITDNSSKGINIITTGSFYQNFPNGIPNILGNYIIFYQAVDGAGNKSSVYGRVVKVVDRTAPVLILKDQSYVFSCRWQPYTDAGYTVSDNFYPVNQLTVDTFSDVEVAAVGMYKVSYQVTDPSGNKSGMITRLIKIKDCASGIAGQGNASLNIYPNPNTGHFTIDLQQGLGELKSVIIINLLGEEIRRFAGDELKGNQCIVDLSNESSGIYTVKVETGSGIILRQVIVGR